MILSLTVNGQPVTVSAAPTTTLASLLRDQLGLKATRIGCEEGVCGSCTVLVDGRSLRGCLTLAVQMDGAAITTAEGYEARPRLAAIQHAFVKHFSAQCGFCTAGMMAVVSEYLADETIADHGDDATIRQRLSAVACRCTGYQPIVEAVQDLARTQGDSHG